MNMFILNALFNFKGAFSIYNRYKVMFLFGIRNTLIISLSATIFGLVIGLFFASLKLITIQKHDRILSRLFKYGLKILANVYIEVFRGTPMMVQSMFLYYGLRPTLGWSPWQAALIIVSVNTGAYMAEIIRAGIQSLDDGQYEAARSIGMHHALAMVIIILPQAIKNSFPAIGNEFVVNIKDTSVLNVIGVSELFFQSLAVAGNVFRFTETFLVTAVIYLILTLTVTSILRIIEKRLDTPAGFIGASSSFSGAFKVFKKGGAT
jgi:putative lysine transport system permease protein